MLGENILRLSAFGHPKVGPGTVVLLAGGDRICFDFLLRLSYRPILSQSVWGLSKSRLEYYLKVHFTQNNHPPKNRMYNFNIVRLFIKKSKFSSTVV